MRELLNQTAEIAARYLETLDGRGVAPTAEALARLAELNEPLPQEPKSPTAVLEMLDRAVRLQRWEWLAGDPSAS